MIGNTKYTKASLEGHETAVKNRITAFVEANQGKTTDEQRSNLPKLKNYLQDAVDYVMDDLPAGVKRVDGYCIEPILEEVCNKKISALPELKVEEPEL